MTTRICLGVDDGHYGIKTFDDRGKSGFVLSRARIGQSHIINTMGNDTGVCELSTDGAEYSCGNIKTYEEINPETFPTSAINRVLVHMALHQHDKGHYIHQAMKQGGEAEIEVCTGLPIGRYFKQGKRNAELVEQKIKNLTIPVSYNNVNGSQLTVKIKPTVTAQTFAAWYDYIITEERSNNKSNNQPKVIKHDERMKESIAFVDLGGGTTDVVVIEGMNFEYVSNPSLTVGSNNVRETLKELISDKFEVDAPSVSIVDAAFKNHKIMYDKKEYDVSALVDKAFRINAEKITAHVKKQIGTKGREVSKLFYIGGSASEFRHSLMGQYKMEEWPADAQIMNARGMYKFQRYIAR